MSNPFSGAEFTTLKRRVFDVASMLVQGVGLNGASPGWGRIVIVTSKAYQTICSVLASHLNCRLIISDPTISITAPSIVVRDLDQSHSGYQVDTIGIPQEAT